MSKKYTTDSVPENKDDRKNVTVTMAYDMWCDLGAVSQNRKFARVPKTDITVLCREAIAAFLETQELITPLGSLDVRRFIETATGTFNQLVLAYAKIKDLEPAAVKWEDAAKWAMRTIKDAAKEPRETD